MDTIYTRIYVRNSISGGLMYIHNSISGGLM